MIPVCTALSPLSPQGMQHTVVIDGPSCSCPCGFPPSAGQLPLFVTVSLIDAPPAASTHEPSFGTSATDTAQAPSLYTVVVAEQVALPPPQVQIEHPRVSITLLT